MDFSMSKKLTASSAEELVAQESRIACLQSLIEQNIAIDKCIELHTFGESIVALDNIIQKANDITEGYRQRKVNNVELVLDTELLRRNHEVFSKAIQQKSNFNDTMFCSGVNQIVIKDDKEDWDALCELACQHSYSLFTNASMLPFIDVKPKKKIAKQRPQRKSKTNCEEKRPKKSDKLERKEENAGLVFNIFTQIKTLYDAGNCQPLPYYKLIIDPEDFMNTVQNSLKVAFLVRDNMICLENDSDGLPHIRVATNADEDSEAISEQAICRLDVHLWKHYIKHYKIKESMLKEGNSNDDSDDL